MSVYTVRTVGDADYRFADDRRLTDEGWLPFMLEDPVGECYFMRLYRDFPNFQFLLYEDDIPVAAGNTIPVIWNLDDQSLSERGWEWALENGFELLETSTAPTTLCALSITVAREYLGKGVSGQALRAMKAIAIQRGLNALIAPVRPTLKASYPLMPLERYIGWTQDDGAPFDPWLRTHWRVGARIVGVAPLSMIISGTIAQWQGWTGLKFPESGEYLVPGALNPVTADVERDLITYVEPNVWMHHPVDPHPLVTP